MKSIRQIFIQKYKKHPPLDLKIGDTICIANSEIDPFFGFVINQIVAMEVIDEECFVIDIPISSIYPVDNSILVYNLDTNKSASFYNCRILLIEKAYNTPFYL